MPWDSVEVGLAGGEETVNFGPRNESGSSLYQVDTLASVSPRGEVRLYVHAMMACVQSLLFFCLRLYASYLIQERQFFYSYAKRKLEERSCRLP